MRLPLAPPIAPMLAKSVRGVPEPSSVEGGLLYEPKWDGFRCIVFRDGDEVELSSRGERPLTRYFPEVVAAVRAQLPHRCVVDGEVVIANGPSLDFEALLQRIHPADSRVRLLAEQTPASFVAFDLLAIGDEDLTSVAFALRRARLVEALADAVPPVFVTPATDDVGLAREWFDAFEGAGLDGIVAKPLAGTYRPDERAMLKVKHERTADCVVAGFRWHKSGGVVGSLLLGLYDDAGQLQHVGVCAAFPMKRRAELVEELAPWRTDDLAAHPWGAWASFAGEGVPERMPGAVSRWNSGKDLSWVALRPERVVEVAYDHMEGSRFRHTAQWRRWRDDRDPRSCTYEQLERPVSFDLATLLA
ncbi:MAG TPA: ATP-dependent DNA ligase [Actinomycetes bacterium]|nr:ATP-dependent DNA ligase [Actinomycetes bacterium]